MATITKVGRPSFYKLTSQPKTSNSGSNLPLYSILILVGVAIVFVLRNKQHVIEGPVLTVVPSNKTDISTMENITQGILAMAGQVTMLGTNPPGGASTPITPNPS